MKYSSERPDLVDKYFTRTEFLLQGADFWLKGSGVNPFEVIGERRLENDLRDYDWRTLPSDNMTTK